MQKSGEKRDNTEETLSYGNILTLKWYTKVIIILEVTTVNLAAYNVFERMAVYEENAEYELGSSIFFVNESWFFQMSKIGKCETNLIMSF